MPTRQRGVVLSDRGLERLESAIGKAEKSNGQSFTQEQLESLVEKANFPQGLTQKTISKIRRQIPVQVSSIRLLFNAFGLALETADYGLSEAAAQISEPQRAKQDRHVTPKIDWGEKPDTTLFFGRTEDLTTLSQWVMVEPCRVVTLLGMGGIGKTSLAAKLAAQIYTQFDYVIWRSLREAPPLDEILVRLIQFLSDQQETEINLPTRLGERIIRLLHYLRERRCLLVLDNLESILQAESAGHYREGYEGYGELIQHIGSTEHQSCLLLTSRECPRELAPMAGDRLPVRLWPLGGLDAEAGRELLKTKGLDLDETDTQSQELIRRYSGNPQALHLVATAIQREFLGDVHDFLEEEGAAVEDVRSLLDQHFGRLATLERSILFWLAINREPVGLEELMEDLLPPVTKQEVRSALRGLSDRYLIETVGKQFTLQNVIMEFVTDRLVEQVSQELNTQQFDLFHTHALIKASAKDYVRETQVRLVLTPTTVHIDNLKEFVCSSLKTIRAQFGLEEGYAAGNLLNLLCQSLSYVRRFDFSRLTLRQACLQGIQLHAFNLTYTRWVRYSLTYPFSEVNSVVFSPDGQWLASGSRDATIRLWQVSTGECRHTLTGHTDWVRSVVFSPDGQWLASSSDDATVRLWQVSTGECRQTLTGHTDWVRSVVFSPDGQWLASGSGDATIRLWQVSTGEYRQTLTGHTNCIRSVVFSPDGQWLASGDQDATIRLWQVSTGECHQSLTGHTDWVNSVVFSPDGQWLASGSGDATIRLWQMNTGECCQTLTGHADWVSSVVFSPNGQWLASGSGDATIRLWQVSTGKCRQTLTGHTRWVRSVVFSPDGQWLASGGQDASIRLWQVSTGEYRQTLTGHTNWVSSVVFSPDGQWLASGGQDASIRLWQVSTGKCRQTLTGHTDWVRSLVFSSDGQWLASGDQDASIRLWQVSTGECLKTLTGHADWVSSVVFSPDGQWLASGSNDATIRLWQVSTGECLQTLTGYTNWIRSVVFSPDGQWLASCSGDASIRLWQVSTGECLQTLTRHTDWVNSVVFSPDGQWLASGSNDATIRLWQVSTGECHQTLTGHTDWVRSVVFSPDGQWLASGGQDATIRLWQLSTGECSAVLQLPRPYEGTDITGARGLTPAQQTSMLILGAVDRASENYPES